MYRAVRPFHTRDKTWYTLGVSVFLLGTGVLLESNCHVSHVSSTDCLLERLLDVVCYIL